MVSTVTAPGCSAPGLCWGPGRATGSHWVSHLPLRPHPSSQATALFSCGKGVAGGFSLTIWDGCSSALGFLGPRREPADGDRAIPLPYLLLAFLGPVREAGVVAIEVSRVEEGLSLVWVGASGRQVNPGSGACVCVFEGGLSSYTLPAVGSFSSPHTCTKFHQPKLPGVLRWWPGLSLVLIRLNSGPGCWLERDHGACWGFPSAPGLLSGLSVNTN